MRVLVGTILVISTAIFAGPAQGEEPTPTPDAHVAELTVTIDEPVEGDVVSLPLPSNFETLSPEEQQSIPAFEGHTLKLTYLGPSDVVTAVANTAIDEDGDGCSNAEELGADPLAGGDRNPLDYFDFFDTNLDLTVDLSDTLDVLMLFGEESMANSSGVPVDRREGVVKPWRSEEAHDGIDLTDAIATLKQFGHSCYGPSASGGGDTSAPVGWWSCEEESYRKNTLGVKVIRLVHKVIWHNSIYQTPSSWEPVDARAYTQLSFWNTDGESEVVEPYYRPYPWAIHSSSRQKFKASYSYFTFQTAYLDVEMDIGPGIQCYTLRTS